MKKMLIITPHCSTGGAPQVTLNKVELLLHDYEIKVVEHSFLAWNYVVQRNQLINLLGDNFISLGDDKFKLLDIIFDFEPDIISMEEFPEMFMEEELIKSIYSKDRNYRIYETTHDSSFSPINKKFFPDKFIFVSAYSALKYSEFEVPIEVIEYPVDKIETQSVNNRIKKIVIVGLWTPRKNQAYAIELSKKLKDYKVQFHFLGNYADNFKYYWEPLMKNLPENCIVHGETSNVISFVKNSDLFLFPSKGDSNNKELNPIAIKEAMMFESIPKLMFNLDVYLNKYNDEKNVNYLTGNVDEDSQKIIDILNLKKYRKELVVIGTYPNSQFRNDLTSLCIDSVKPLNRDILLLSHFPVNSDIQNKVDYYLYDKHNPLIKHSYYNSFSRTTEDYSVNFKIEGEYNQSLTVLTNLVNAAKFAKAHEYSHFFYITFDVIIDSRDYDAIEASFSKLDSEWKAYLATLPTPFGKGIQTNGMTFDTELALKFFDDVRFEDEYNSICESIGAHNFLEDYLIKKVNITQNIWVTYPEEGTFLKYSGQGESSNSEYYGILNLKDSDDKVFYYFSYNTLSTSNFKLILRHSDNRVIDEHNIKNSLDFYTILPKDCNSVEFIISEVINDTPYDQSFMFYTNNPKGEIVLTNNKQKPKIKLVHLQVDLDDDRQIKSRESLMKVKNYSNWQYVLKTNEIYKHLPPIENCARPECVSLELFDKETEDRLGTALTPAHYGCYTSFIRAIFEEFYDCDYLILCEGDCLIETDTNSFIETVEKCASKLESLNVGFMSFGDKDTLEYGWPQSPIIQEVDELMYITNKIIGLQCIMFPKFIKSELLNKILTNPWDASDIYFNNIFNKMNCHMGILHKRITTQADGYSLIDKQFKTFR